MANSLFWKDNIMTKKHRNQLVQLDLREAHIQISMGFLPAFGFLQRDKNIFWC
jgi:hypothetical protein